MIQVYNEKKEENKNRMYITEIAFEEDTQYIYFECKDNENLNNEIRIFKEKHIKRILEELAKKRDSEFEYNKVRFNNFETRCREKDCNAMQMLALTGGEYVFDNGVATLTTTQAKELLKKMLDKKTKIVKYKQELEQTLQDMNLFELQRYNPYCKWVLVFE